MIHHRCIDLKIPQRRYRLAFASVAAGRSPKQRFVIPQKWPRFAKPHAKATAVTAADGDLGISCERLSPIVFCKCRRSMSAAALERMENRTPTPLIWDRFAIMISFCQ
jgi:hypothetical protein